MEKIDNIFLILSSDSESSDEDNLENDNSSDSDLSGI